MIKFLNNNQQEPYNKLLDLYNKALKNKQKAIEAIAISSYDTEKNEVNSRFVNLKIVDGEEFIFFSNYNSTKAKEFLMHQQVSVTIYWSKINIQIRLKGFIKKTSIDLNNTYFSSRPKNKNILAISSYQSQVIESYEKVIKKYDHVKDEDEIKGCPKYWGGYTFKPYEIEFWEGKKYRLNKRDLYKKNKEYWEHYILEP